MRVDSYLELEQYLRDWRQWGDPDGEYDANGIFHLLLACLDNLRHKALEAELGNYASFSDEQTEFLNRLLDYSKRSA
jgi:hypothetical protein